MWESTSKDPSGAVPPPTAGQLLKSTIVAAASAVAIVVCVFLPAEHAIDPTGIGRWLGLTQMGEIRQQLVEYARADASQVLMEVSHAATLASIERRLQQIELRLNALDQPGKSATPLPAQRQ
jgi:hypothetical protein